MQIIKSNIRLRSLSLSLLTGTMVLFLLSSCSIFRKKNKHAAIGQNAAGIARGYIGTPYRAGGNDSRGIDCSGLICQSYVPLGLKLPRISWQQAEFGRQIDIADVIVGDLVFFVTSKKAEQNSINHAGIISMIDGKEVYFIHASTSKGVREDKLLSEYWRKVLVKITRPF